MPQQLANFPLTARACSLPTWRTKALKLHCDTGRAFKPFSHGLTPLSSLAAFACFFLCSRFANFGPIKTIYLLRTQACDGLHFVDLTTLLSAVELALLGVGVIYLYIWICLLCKKGF